MDEVADEATDEVTFVSSLGAVSEALAGDWLFLRAKHQSAADVEIFLVVKM